MVRLEVMIDKRRRINIPELTGKINKLRPSESIFQFFLNEFDRVFSSTPEKKREPFFVDEKMYDLNTKEGYIVASDIIIYLTTYYRKLSLFHDDDHMKINVPHQNIHTEHSLPQFMIKTINDGKITFNHTEQFSDIIRNIDLPDHFILKLNRLRRNGKIWKPKIIFEIPVTLKREAIEKLFPIPSYKKNQQLKFVIYSIIVFEGFFSEEKGETMGAHYTTWIRDSGDKEKSNNWYKFDNLGKPNTVITGPIQFTRTEADGTFIWNNDLRTIDALELLKIFTGVTHVFYQLDKAS
jgi:hypothetical protein